VPVQEQGQERALVQELELELAPEPVLGLGRALAQELAQELELHSQWPPIRSPMPQP